MDCSHCGTPLTTSSRFCPGCGLRIGTAAHDVAGAEPPAAVEAAIDLARTVVVPAASRAAGDPPTAPLSVVADPGLTVVVPAAASEPLPGSAEFRANPTVVIRAAHHPAQAARDLPAAPEPWPGDETVVVRAPLAHGGPPPSEPFGTEAVAVFTDDSLAQPSWDGDATVVVPAYVQAPVDPTGTVVVPVQGFPAEAPEPESWAPVSERAHTPEHEASWAPAPEPAALATWTPSPEPHWPMPEERTEETLPVASPEPEPEPGPPPPLPWFAAPVRSAEEAAPPFVAAPAPPPLAPVAVAAPMPPLPPPPEPPPAPAAPVSPAVAAPAAAGQVPTSVSRPAASGSATKLAAWVATLAVVGGLGVFAARRWMAAAPETPAPSAPVPASTVEASCETEASLKSTPGSGQAMLQVTNKTAAPVVVHWLNLTGAREKWFAVSPGAMRNQRTPPTYKWVVTRADGTCLAVISGQGSVVVE